jgi:hypothetical protein
VAVEAGGGQILCKGDFGEKGDGEGVYGGEVKKELLMAPKKSAVKMMAAALVLVTLASACPGQTYWRRTYGEVASWVTPYAITNTPDGNYIVAGCREFYDPEAVGIYLFKINPDGDKIWTKTYGGINDDIARAIAPTPDGNFIVVGSTFSFSENRDIYLLKIKPNGDTIWTKTYGGTGDEWVNDILPLPDGNFFVLGFTSSRGAGERDVYLLLMTQSGDTVWTKTYGESSNDYGNEIISTADGNFIIAGYTESFEARNDNAYFIKIKTNGDTIWTRNYGGTKATNLLGYWKDYWAEDIVHSSDGNYMAVGLGFSTGSEGIGYYSCLYKIDSYGDTIWTKNIGYGNWTSCCAILETKDQKFLVIASDTLIKLDIDGDVIWKKAFNVGDCQPVAITNTPDGNYICMLGLRNGGNCILLSLIDDRYAYKGIPFAFKIPVSGDSVSHGYTPLKVPSGMTVSMGGTISWIPKTDSVYLDHVEFLVSDDYGRKDTLTFNIFVNSSYHPIKTINPISRSVNSSLSEITICPLSSKEVRFSLPTRTSSVQIYDVRGQLLENIPVNGGQAIWLAKRAAGRYFAKAIVEKKEMVKGFVLIK